MAGFVKRIFCGIACLSFMTGSILFPAAAEGNAQTVDALRFGDGGKFTILQISDTQDTDSLSKDTYKMITAALDQVQPDLVIFTGDQLEGYSPTFKISPEKKVKSAIDALVAPLAEREVPFAVAFGNHDAQSGISKEAQMAMYASYPNCVSRDEGDLLEGCGTNRLPVMSSDGKKTAFNLFVIDSLEHAREGGYAHVSTGQIEFCREEAEKSARENGGKTVPSMVFQHIAVPEIYDALKETDECTGGAVEGFRTHSGRYYILDRTNLVGENTENYFLREAPCPPDVNSGQFDAWLASGDVIAAFFGHDHSNNFVSEYRGIDLGYCPTSGFNAYGDGYNRGVRVIELDENTPAEYRTYTLLYDDLVEEELQEAFAFRVVENTPISFEQFKFAAAAATLLVIVLAAGITGVLLVRRKRKNSKRVRRGTRTGNGGYGE